MRQDNIKKWYLDNYKKFEEVAFLLISIIKSSQLGLILLLFIYRIFEWKINYTKNTISRSQNINEKKAGHQ